jgi:hypothetical protein
VPAVVVDQADLVAAPSTHIRADGPAAAGFNISEFADGERNVVADVRRSGTMSAARTGRRPTPRVELGQSPSDWQTFPLLLPPAQVHSALPLCRRPRGSCAVSRRR